MVTEVRGKPATQATQNNQGSKQKPGDFFGLALSTPGFRSAHYNQQTLTFSTSEDHFQPLHSMPLTSANENSQNGCFKLPGIHSPIPTQRMKHTSGKFFAFSQVFKNNQKLWGHKCKIVCITQIQNIPLPETEKDIFFHLCINVCVWSDLKLEMKFYVVCKLPTCMLGTGI